jgi:phage shock protein PspC (stress-responsive transcriptional regulator)
VNDIRHSLARQGLVRSDTHRILGGVSAGLGRRIGLGPWAARLLVVLVVIVLPGSSLALYPIAWVLMPSAERARSYDLAPAPVAPVARV